MKLTYEKIYSFLKFSFIVFFILIAVKSHATLTQMKVETGLIETSSLINTFAIGSTYEQCISSANSYGSVDVWRSLSSWATIEATQQYKDYVADGWYYIWTPAPIQRASSFVGDSVGVCSQDSTGHYQYEIKNFMEYIYYMEKDIPPCVNPDLTGYHEVENYDCYDKAYLVANGYTETDFICGCIKTRSDGTEYTPLYILDDLTCQLGYFKNLWTCELCPALPVDPFVWASFITEDICTDNDVNLPYSPPGTNVLYTNTSWNLCQNACVSSKSYCPPESLNDNGTCIKPTPEATSECGKWESIVFTNYGTYCQQTFECVTDDTLHQYYNVSCPDSSAVDFDKDGETALTDPDDNNPDVTSKYPEGGNPDDNNDGVPDANVDADGNKDLKDEETPCTGADLTTIVFNGDPKAPNAYSYYGVIPSATCSSFVPDTYKGTFSTGDLTCDKEYCFYIPGSTVTDNNNSVNPDTNTTSADLQPLLIAQNNTNDILKNINKDINDLEDSSLNTVSELKLISEKITNQSTSLSAINSNLYNANTIASQIKANGDLSNAILSDINGKATVISHTLKEIRDKNSSFDTSGIEKGLKDVNSTLTSALTGDANGTDTSALEGVTNDFIGDVNSTINKLFNDYNSSMTRISDGLSIMQNGFTNAPVASSVSSCPASYPFDLVVTTTNVNFDVCEATVQLRPVAYPVAFISFSVTFIMIVINLVLGI